MTADMLIKMGLTGELFHTVAGTAFADLPINACPIRSKRFRWWLRSCHYAATGMAPGAGAITSALDCSRPALNLMVLSGRSTSASRRMPAASISTSPMIVGAPSKLDRTDGRSGCLTLTVPLAVLPLLKQMGL
jgi:hypothetical protein